MTAWHRSFAVAGALSFATLPLAAAAAPVVFSVGGSDAASIQATVDSFRGALGALNPNVPGSFGTGRREVNWDGVPAAASSPNPFPANFFNTTSPRGSVYGTPGSGFQVSASPGVAPVEFDNINPTYSTLFATFSPVKLFTVIGSTVTDVNFFVPGSTTPAFVTGFGSVFTDVDLANITSIQLFDAADVSLGTFFVSPATVANAGLSFLGIFFTEGAVISRARITSGNGALGPNESGALDLVVMDDFIYGEPRTTVAAVPEPTAALLLAGGLVAAIAGRRRGRPTPAGSKAA